MATAMIMGGERPAAASGESYEVFNPATGEVVDRVPDAGPAEAHQYVLRLADSLRAQHPGKFVPPPLSLATLNWNAMLLCVVIAAVILGVFWIIMPPSYPAWSAAQIACGFLFGLGLMAGVRVKGFWQRMLLLGPAIAATVLVEAIMSYSAGFFFAPTRSVAAYTFGFFFGLFLMGSGFTRRRRQSSSKP